MNYKILAGATLILILSVFVSCSYDHFPEIEPVEEVSFSMDIIPIMESSCSTANCHDGSFHPNLTTGLAYFGLVPEYVDTMLPAESLLIKSIEFLPGISEMPPGVQLSELDRTLILQWIENGALNN